MPKIIKKEEIVLFEGLRISDFLDKEFLKKVEKIGLEVDAINLVLMVNGNKKESYPLILGHHNNKDLEERRMHISSPTKDVPENFIKLLEDIDNGE
jgi:hypothetical protein